YIPAPDICTVLLFKKELIVFEYPSVPEFIRQVAERQGNLLILFILHIILCFHPVFRFVFYYLTDQLNGWIIPVPVPSFSYYNNFFHHCRVYVHLYIDRPVFTRLHFQINAKVSDVAET